MRNNLPTIPDIRGDRRAKTSVEQFEEPAQREVEHRRKRVAVRGRGLSSSRAQGRAQRQGIQGRQDRGDGDGQGELAEEQARDARDEHARQKHAREHQADGHDRRRDLVHGLVRAARGIIPASM